MLEQAEIQGPQFPGDRWGVGGNWDPRLSKKSGGERAGHTEGLTRGFALLGERCTGAQSRAAPRGGAARVAQARAGGPYGGRLAARAVGEV